MQEERPENLQMLCIESINNTPGVTVEAPYSNVFPRAYKAHRLGDGKRARQFSDANAGTRRVTRSQTRPILVAVGNTIRAGPGARVGDRGVVDGVEYTIRDRAHLRRLIAEKRWAEVEQTCTSLITDFSELFRGAEDFNASISHWDTSSVTDMSRMFCGAIAFNQPIGAWNTISVTNMKEMFLVAAAFNQPIGDWDTSSVTDMRGMLYGASSFDQPIGRWETRGARSSPM